MTDIVSKNYLVKYKRIIELLIVLAILFVPIPKYYKDGGTKILFSLTYAYAEWSVLDSGENGFGSDYTGTNFVLFPHNFGGYEGVWNYCMDNRLLNYSQDYYDRLDCIELNLRKPLADQHTSADESVSITGLINNNGETIVGITLSTQTSPISSEWETIFYKIVWDNQNNIKELFYTNDDPYVNQKVNWTRK